MMNKNLRSYFHWVNEHFTLDLADQPRYLMKTFNTLEDFNWNIDATLTYTRMIERDRFPNLLDFDDQSLKIHMKRGVGESRELSDKEKVAHLMKYLIRYSDKYKEFDDKELPEKELDYKKMILAYINWEAENYKPPFLVEKRTLGF